MTRRAGWLALAVMAAAACAHGPAGPLAPLYDGLGEHHHPVTTRSPLAQRYFDQGLRLHYAFNHDEAVRSFREAARLDPDCAMAYWGQALALGGNLNAYPQSEGERRQAWQALTEARTRAHHASAAERAYIEALGARYADPPPADRKPADRAYAEAMRALARAHLDDLDAQVLEAEALAFLVVPTLGAWSNDGQPAAETSEAIAVLESVLARAPDHPGANHYYIHLVEGSPHPERALQAADRISRLMPAAGHILHMPSHIYLRVGRYGDAIDANLRAIAVDDAYLQHNHPGHFYPTFAAHNVWVLWYAALMAGASAQAQAAARELERRADSAPMHEEAARAKLKTLVRFGRWDQVLAEPAPASERSELAAAWHYARALALAARGRLDQADQERAQLARRAAAAEGSSRALLQIASNHAAGSIAARRGRLDEAIGRLRAAVEAEDGLNRNVEPPQWSQPLRPALGALLFEAGRASEAEAVYREDLLRNPENGWALHGLLQCLRARRAAAEAAQVEARFRKAWSRADVTLSGSP